MQLYIVLRCVRFLPVLSSDFLSQRRRPKDVSEHVAVQMDVQHIRFLRKGIYIEQIRLVHLQSIAGQRIAFHHSHALPPR